MRGRDSNMIKNISLISLFVFLLINETYSQTGRYLIKEVDSSSFEHYTYILLQLVNEESDFKVLFPKNNNERNKIINNSNYLVVGLREIESIKFGDFWVRMMTNGMEVGEVFTWEAGEKLYGIYEYSECKLTTINDSLYEWSPPRE